MAKVTFGPTVSDARGSIGSTTFSRNRYGAYTRNRTAPRNLPTAPRTTQNALYTTLAAAWSTITQDQRSSWHALADANPRINKLGGVYRMTGTQLFVRCNSLLAQAGAAMLAAAPANLDAGDPGPVTTLQAGTTPVSLLVAVQRNPTVTEAIELWCSDPMNLGRRFFTNRLKLITTKTTPGPWDIGAAYLARFGSISTDKNIAARVRLINLTNGAPGPWRSELGSLMPPPVNFADNEIPAGAIDGVNTAFLLALVPSPGSSLALYWNGLFMFQPGDYTLSGNSITTNFAPNGGDTLVAFYRY